MSSYLRGALAAVAGLASLALMTLSAAGAEQGSAEPHWVGAWATGQQPPHIGLNLGPASGISEAGFNNHTVRLLVYPTLAGDQLRIRLGNTFGTQPLTIGAAAVGWQSEGAALVPDSNHAITFAGRSAVTIPIGAEVYSDPVPLAVEAGQMLAISVYVPSGASPHPAERGGIAVVEAGQPDES